MANISIIATLSQYPYQGIRALVDKVYLYNPLEINGLIVQLNELIEKIDGIMVVGYKGLNNKPVLNTTSKESLLPEEGETIVDTIMLHEVSKTGDYKSLLNLPPLGKLSAKDQIKDADVADDAAIARSKLASDVVASLDLADTAVQTADYDAKMEDVDASISALNSGLQAEKKARTDADTTLQDNIDSEASTRASEDSKLATGLSDETIARENAGAVLQTNIDNEVARATAAENALGTRITDEATARTAADSTLQTNIDNVSTATQAALDGKVSKSGDTMSGNLIFGKNSSLYLSSVGSTVANTTSRLNLGTPGKVYSYLAGNTQGAFGIYSELSGTRAGIACYPSSSFFADATTKTIDLGSSGNVWKTLYANILSDGSTSASTATVISGAEAGATAVQPADLAKVATSGSYDDLTNKPTIGNATLTITRNNESAGNFSANAIENKTINIAVPISASDVNALPDSTKYGASFTLTMDSTTYKISASLKDQDGNVLGAVQSIDLPLESVVVSGSYDAATKEVVLTLEDGSEIRFSVADLVDGLQTEITETNKLSADLVNDGTSVNKFVTSAEKSTWNNKQNAISDLATIRSGAAKGATAVQPNDNVSVLKNDAGYLTQHQSLTDLGITATASEINVLDGITASTTELNYTDGVTSNIQTQLNSKQSTISDLATIRSNAQSGKTASDTIATYGNIVTHNTSEFATSAQGAKADTAVQPADLATVATTGSYSDLTNKPTIPTTLAGLTGDVSISSPAQGQHLVYDGSKWKNTASAGTVVWGDITGTLSEQSDLQTALNAKQSALTTTQLNAVNSGITSTKVSSYDAHITNKSNPHAVTKAQVGLGNVNNTSDADKPVSTAQAKAIGVVQSNLDEESSTRADADSALSERITANATDISGLKTTVAGKQDVLTAGDGIKIEENVISETLTNSANTWTGTQVYMATTKFNGEVDVRASGPEITFINTEDDSTATPTTQQNYCLKMADKKGVTVSGYEYHHGTDGSKFAQIAVMHGSSTAVFNIGFNASGTMYADASSGIKNSMAGWFTNVYEKLGNKVTSFTATTANNTNFPTTKAVVDYVSSAATKVDIDNSTITKNASGELQASAVVNQNTGILKSWTGTLAEYNALATKSDDTQYIITDDDSAGTNVYTKAEVDSLVNSVLATADYVVAFQAPTAANGYAWYREYKSGWVEQGGIHSVGKLNDGAAISGAITPHIQMADNAYYVSLVPTSPANYNRLFANLGPRTNNEFYFGVRNIGGTTSDISVCWQVSGMAA